MASIEEFFTEFEKAKAESKEAQLRAKEFKDMIINEMTEKGVDEMVINGLDGLVVLEITYPVRYARHLYRSCSALWPASQASEIGVGEHDGEWSIAHRGDESPATPKDTREHKEADIYGHGYRLVYLFLGRCSDELRHERCVGY